MRGRTAVYEIMPMTETLREMVLRRTSSAALRTQAIREGMLTLREAGIRKVIEGVTTPDEVARILLDEE